jgi:hypothetical protein
MERYRKFLRTYNYTLFMLLPSRFSQTLQPKYDTDQPLFSRLLFRHYLDHIALYDIFNTSNIYHFMRLPEELQNAIYAYALHHPSGVHSNTTEHKSWHLVRSPRSLPVPRSGLLGHDMSVKSHTSHVANQL